MDGVPWMRTARPSWIRRPTWRRTAFRFRRRMRLPLRSAGQTAPRPCWSARDSRASTCFAGMAARRTK
eukprot:9514235-Prorocentrum_lima.AAC.1